MKQIRKKIELLCLTFKKLYMKLRNKMEISEGAPYNISIQLKTGEETLGNSDYLTRSEPCKGEVSCNTIYSV